MVYCDTSQQRIMDLDNSCEIQKSKYHSYHELLNILKSSKVDEFKRKIKEELGVVPRINYLVGEDMAYETPLIIVSKLHDEVSGNDISCTINHVSASLNTDILFNHIPPIISRETVVMTSIECKKMIASNKCNGNQMICEHGVCRTIQPNLENAYPQWWSTIIFEYDECSYNKVTITADKISDDVLKEGCKATSGECSFYDSITIWNTSEIIHLCPYERLTTAMFNLTNSNIVIAREETPMAFEITSVEEVCGTLKVYKTTTSLYLTPHWNNKEASQLMKQSKRDANLIQEETTAEQDYYRIKYMDIESVEEQRRCLEFRNSLELARKTLNNEFYKVKDYENKELIYYIKDKKVFVPQCNEEFAIEILKHIETCFEDTPVRWMNLKTKINGTAFLTAEKVLRKDSTLISCERKGETYIEVDDNRKYIHGEFDGINYKYSLKKNVKKHVKMSLLTYTQPHLKHAVAFHERVGDKHTLDHKIAILENKSYVYIERKHQQNEKFKEKVDGFYRKITSSWTNFKEFLAYLTMSIIVSLISMMITCCCVKINTSIASKILSKDFYLFQIEIWTKD